MFHYQLTSPACTHRMTAASNQSRNSEGGAQQAVVVLMVSRWVWMFLLKLNEDNKTFVLIFVFRVDSEQRKSFHATVHFRSHGMLNDPSFKIPKCEIGVILSVPATSGRRKYTLSPTVSCSKCSSLK